MAGEEDMFDLVVLDVSGRGDPMLCLRNGATTSNRVGVQGMKDAVIRLGT